MHSFCYTEFTLLHSILLHSNILCSKVIKTKFALKLINLILKQAVLYKNIQYLLDPVPQHNALISATGSKASQRCEGNSLTSVPFSFLGKASLVELAKPTTESWRQCTFFSALVGSTGSCNLV